MADLVVKAGRLLAVQRTLAEVLGLTPPATPKGRYALSRQASAVEREVEKYTEQHAALLKKHAATNEAGQPLTQPITLPNGQSGVQYDLGAGFGQTTPAFEAELKELNDEDITLPGVRMITHAELGGCPITGTHELILLAAGLLEDKEPD